MYFGKEDIQVVPNCILEWNVQRGVLYVHNKDTGATVLRICQLRVPANKKVGRLVDGQIDITHMHSASFPLSKTRHGDNMRKDSIQVEEKDGEVYTGYLEYAISRTSSRLKLTREQALALLKKGTIDNPIEVDGVKYWDALE